MFDDLSLYGRYNRIIGQIGLPWWKLGGNHDLNFEAPDSRYSRETFKRVFGANYYAFEYGDALFLMLDNVEYLGTDSAKPRRAGKYRGFFGERQLAFAANALRETPSARLVVAVMHIPLRNYLDPDDPSFNTADRAEFLALLGGRNAVSFAGHTHTTEHHYFSQEDGFSGTTPHHHHVLTAVSGSWWSGPLDRRGIASADSRDGTPHGFHVLSIDGAGYTTRFVPANEPDARQMRISLDADFHFGRDSIRDFWMGQLQGSPLSKDQLAAATLIVNVFDGGPKTTVEYRIGTGGTCDEDAKAARSFCRRGVWPQQGYHQVLGQGGAVVAYLGGPLAALARRRRSCDRRACGGRIWPEPPRPASFGSHRLRQRFFWLLPALRSGREAERFLGGAEQGLRLVDAFALFGGRIGIIDDSRAGLHMHRPILDNGGAQDNARVPLARGAEIADAAAIDSALVGFEFVDNFHRPHFWRAGNGAGGKSGTKRVDDIVLGGEPAFDVRDDMHDMDVALDREFLGHLDRPCLRDAPHIVAAEIEQHQMLGAFLFVRQELRRQTFVLGLRLAAPAGARDGPDGDFSAPHAHQDFRTRTDDLERSKIEVAEKRRGVDSPQRPVERKGG